MKSQRTKRVLAGLGILLLAAVGVVAYFGYKATRDPGFDWDAPNVVDASEAHRKLRQYRGALEKGERGYFRFSQAEINSYLSFVSTNKVAGTNNLSGTNVVGGNLGARRQGIELRDTNLFVNTIVEQAAMGYTLPLALQRRYRVEQEGTNDWALALEGARVGDLPLRTNFWPRVETMVRPFDEDWLARLTGTTNIPAIMIGPNATTKEPELRLYTYKPIPAEDFPK